MSVAFFFDVERIDGVSFCPSKGHTNPLQALLLKLGLCGLWDVGIVPPRNIKWPHSGLEHLFPS